MSRVSSLGEHLASRLRTNLTFDSRSSLLKMRFLIDEICRLSAKYSKSSLFSRHEVRFRCSSGVEIASSRRRTWEESFSEFKRKRLRLTRLERESRRIVLKSG